jgi:hypothetical protein
MLRATQHVPITNSTALTTHDAHFKLQSSMTQHCLDRLKQRQNMFAVALHRRTLECTTCNNDQKRNDITSGNCDTKGSEAEDRVVLASHDQAFASHSRKAQASITSTMVQRCLQLIGHKTIKA